MKKAILYLVVALMSFAPYMAQNEAFAHEEHEEQGNKGGNRKFNPEEYQKKLEAHITRFAGLTPQEAQAFFPIFREMQQKQRAIYMKQKRMDRTVFTDNKSALEAITLHDNAELEIKKLQITYHKRFLKVLPATKVLKCITAEEFFNREMMRDMAGKRGGK